MSRLLCHSMRTSSTNCHGSHQAVQILYRCSDMVRPALHRSTQQTLEFHLIALQAHNRLVVQPEKTSIDLQSQAVGLTFHNLTHSLMVNSSSMERIA